MTKTILITGAGGFIGSHLGNKLVELGYNVIGVDYVDIPKQKLNFRLLKISFQNISCLMFESIDVIFHLAADINVDESIEYPEKYMTNNTLGTLDLLEKIRKISWKGKFIYASSAEVYGSSIGGKMNESHPTNPLSPYAVSKLAAENLCRNYKEMFGLNITVIRNFNTFGEHQGDGIYGGVIAKFCKLAKNGKKLPLYGSGEQMRDYMHISQAVQGYILAMDKDLPTIVNFGSGKPIKIINIAEVISKSFGVEILFEKPRLNEVFRLEADVSLAEQYGYRVETDFWVNLRLYIDFIKKK